MQPKFARYNEETYQEAYAAGNAAGWFEGFKQGQKYRHKASHLLIGMALAFLGGLSLDLLGGWYK